MENSMEASQKSKNRTTIWSGNFTSVYTSKGKIQNTNPKKKNTCTAMFIAALFTIAKDMETIKKNEILPFVTTQKDLDGIMLSVVSQTNTVSLIYGI